MFINFFFESVTQSARAYDYSIRSRIRAKLFRVRPAASRLVQAGASVTVAAKNANLQESVWCGRDGGQVISGWGHDHDVLSVVRTAIIRATKDKSSFQPLNFTSTKHGSISVPQVDEFCLDDAPFGHQYLDNFVMSCAVAIGVDQRSILVHGARETKLALSLNENAKRVVVVDARRELLAVESSKIAGFEDGEGRVSFSCAHVTALPFPSETFHMFLSVLHLQFLRNIEVAMLEIARVLRDNGVALFAFWDRGPIVEALDLALGEMHAAQRNIRLEIPGMFRQLLTRSGFSASKLHQVHLDLNISGGNLLHALKYGDLLPAGYDDAILRSVISSIMSSQVDGQPTSGCTVSLLVAYKESKTLGG